MALSACSGSVGTTPPSPTPLPPQPPSFRYAGAMTQHFAYAYGYPSQQPPITVRTTLSDRVTVNAAVPPPSISSDATDDVKIVETAATSLETNMTTTNAYVSSNAGSVLLYGAVSSIAEASGGQSSTTTTVYTKPQTLAEASGTWSNSPASTVKETYSDGHSEDRTIAADGTYTENGTTFGLNAKPAPIVLQEEASGAGMYEGPFTGCPNGTAFRFSAPSGSPPTIALTLTSTVSYCSSSTASSIDLWYATPPSFYGETDEADASTTVPVGCGKFKGTTAAEVRSEIVHLDTIIGYTEVTSTHTYVKDNAPVCILFSDDLLNYYDWQGDTPAFLLYSPNAKPISAVTTDESLVQKSASGSLPALTPEIVAAARAHFAANVERARAKLLDAMIHRLQTAREKTGGK
jgi:hypothetical protein